MTKISAVTVCINYDDFLVHCIDNYIAAFDELIVVTESEDLKTRKLCEKFGVRIVESKSKQYNGEPFNLPALLNDGFATIESPEWLCKIDPDIYIPKTAVSRFRQSFGAFDEIWGASRYFCEDTAQLESFIETNDFEVLEPPYEEGDDVLGFLQVFHASSAFLPNSNRPYEQEFHVGPSRTNDRLFCRQWPVEKRKRFPFDVIHLGLEAIGSNWKGRKSGRFV